MTPTPALCDAAHRSQPAKVLQSQRFRTKPSHFRGVLVPSLPPRRTPARCCNDPLLPLAPAVWREPRPPTEPLRAAPQPAGPLSSRNSSIDNISVSVSIVKISPLSSRNSSIGNSVSCLYFRLYVHDRPSSERVSITPVPQVPRAQIV